ncbi:hypothetical protein KAI58_02450 [Candidatus Gracilibacteria bacterium]|nr:hypothetical protein [Candidatus Gracilibacteria bacterium]
MNYSQTELEQFLKWFSQQESIPLQTRRDFFKHISEIGGLDEKAIAFIDKTIESIKSKSQKTANTLQQKIDLISAALKIQEEPRLSLKENIVTEISDWMIEKAQNFKNVFQEKENVELKKEESSEEIQNQTEIDTLKAAIT